MGSLVYVLTDMPLIKLISTDFDGTLIGFSSDGRCSPQFADAIMDHKERGGLWAVNTGRDLHYAVEGVLQFDAPVAPDFLLTNEREVFRWDAGWAAHGEWNARCRQRHDELFEIAAEIFVALELLSKQRDGIRLIYEENRPVGLTTETEALMDLIVRDIDLLAASFSDFSYQRNTVYLRFCHRDYHKGTALSELCRLENIPVDHVFAAGDHYNDLPMLDVRYSAMTACPANAIEPVKERVTLAKGFISQKNCADGVADAMRFYTENEAMPSGAAFASSDA